MEKDKVKEVLKDIFHQVAPEVAFDGINMSLPLRDQVEIDSFDFYNIIVMLQKKINVVVPDSKLSELKNLSQLIDFISAKAGELK
ncbi:MAG: hypothetical protein A2X86_14010 [Bdellovibrionales bacterium GWA2_49_15]|nr:MAG: hypothetical protein A2X86_14010 [Bdellovibrionales bacterium GWA2_49_15]HAZ12732.1 hypothetical protein [Bdellovibrionales bacterium]